MSNSLVLAAVTSTIRYMLHHALETGPVQVSQATVETRHPSKLSGAGFAAKKGINVYCFQVTPNAAGNARALPTRRADDSLITRPSAALDLHYLISCYGDDDALEPQRLLGLTIGTLTARPVFPRGLISAAVACYKDSHPFLSQSDLHTAVELVKLSPTTLSLEESSNLWGLFDTPHLLSVTYMASVAEITVPEPPRVAPPVLRHVVDVRATGTPRLDSVVMIGEGAAATAGAEVVLRGSRLLGPGARVRIGPAELTPTAGSTDAEMRAELTADVPAGMHPVQVTHHAAAEPGGTARRVPAVSNAVPLVVRPTVSVTPQGGLAVAPPLRTGQRVTVLLSRLPRGSTNAPLEVSWDVPVTEETSTELSLPDEPVPPGAWLVRVRVDGVDSLPGHTGETFDEPRLVVRAAS